MLCARKRSLSVTAASSSDPEELRENGRVECADCLAQVVTVLRGCDGELRDRGRGAAALRAAAWTGATTGHHGG